MALHNNKNIVELTNIQTICNHNYHLLTKNILHTAGFGEIHYLITLLFHAWMLIYTITYLIQFDMMLNETLISNTVISLFD